MGLRGTVWLAETLDLGFYIAFALRHLVALNGGFTFALQQLLHVLGHLLAAFQWLTALLTKLAQRILRRQPHRRIRCQFPNTLLKLFQFLDACHPLFASLANALRQRVQAFLQLSQQRIKIVRLIVLAVAFAELLQQPFGIVL